MQRGLYTVLTDKGELTAKVTGKFIHQAENKACYPVVGDWVVVANAAQAMIKVPPRRSRFAWKVPIIKTVLSGHGFYRYLPGDGMSYKTLLQY